MFIFINRLTGLLKQEKQIISNGTVTQFLLPLATCYLFTEAYATQNHLIDAAIECLQAIARTLSWPNYEKLLRFYLSNMTRQMQYQKQAVKAVVAILNGFHFDLKNSQFKSYYANKAKELQSKSDKVNISASVVIDGSLDGDEVPSSLLPDLDAEEETQAKDDEKSVNFIMEDMATKIHSVIVQSLLPDLNSILTARSKREMQHKSAKQDYYPEDDEILRVPIALALVNLLKNLPSGALERNLPG
jgi:U3 small nucleolar RNA-associated protein 20